MNPWLASMFDYVFQLPFGAIIILIGIACIIVAILGRLPPNGKEIQTLSRALLGIFGLILILAVIYFNLEDDVPPEVLSLTSDPHSPAIIGTDIVWNASVFDPDEISPIRFRFLINSASTGNKWIIVRDWGLINAWTWKTTSTKPGVYKIKVEVIDDKHSGPDGNDSFSIEEYQLSEIKIANPTNDSNVAWSIYVDGTISGGLPEGRHMWILVNPQLLPNQWWPQGGRSISPGKEQWSGQATIGGGPEKDIGNKFDIAAVLVDEKDHKMLENWVIETNRNSSWPSINFPPSAKIVDQVTVMRRPG